MREGNHDSYCGLPLIALLVIVLDDQRSAIPATLAAVETAGIAAGNCPDLCGVAYRAVQPFHNRYMSDIRDNSRVE
jgi:hypothetical protein